MKLLTDREKRVLAPAFAAVGVMFVIVVIFMSVIYALEQAP
jgi:hypothetical protein